PTLPRKRHNLQHVPHCNTAYRNVRSHPVSHRNTLHHNNEKPAMNAQPAADRVRRAAITADCLAAEARLAAANPDSTCLFDIEKIRLCVL
ncbi:hypothetical protein M3615_21530, partial [Bacillus halotolerans]|nr:hypothetical protein [Bacillus halotolerans]